MSQPEVYLMIRRRAAGASIKTSIGCHTFRATGITAYLKNGGPAGTTQVMNELLQAEPSGLAPAEKIAGSPVVGPARVRVPDITGMQLTLAFALGIAASLLANYIYQAITKRRRAHQLKTRYGHLAGTYANYRVKNGVEEPTGGTIRVAQQADGSFEAKGLHAPGDVE